MAAGSILIVDGIATNRVVLKVRLEAAFLHTLLAPDGATALRLAREHRPDLILLDRNLPDMPGLDLLHCLAGEEATRRIPVLFLATGAEDGLRQAALAAGAVDVLAKPVPDMLLMARLRNLLRLREDLHGVDLPLFGMAEAPAGFVVPGRVGLIFRRSDTALALRRGLSRCSADQFLLMQRDCALGPAGPTDGPAAPLPPTDAYVLDSALSPGGGLRLLSELRSRGETRHAGICLWQSGPDSAEAAQAYDLGADDVLSADMPVPEVALRLSAVIARRREGQRQRSRLHDTARLASVDDLTGLWNRRYALPQLAAMAAAAQDGGRGLAVMVLDIDRFKSVNDRHGHAAGNAVLVAVARRLRDILKTEVNPLIARIGGEEFLVALPCTSVQDAHGRAEALCEGIRNHVLEQEGLPRIGVTISVGLAMLAGAEPVAQAVDRADRALLAAKERGRDRVTLAWNMA